MKMSGSLLIISLLFNLISAAQEFPDPPPMEEIMTKYMEMAKPGEEHKILYTLAGSWEHEVRVRMAPGAEPMLFTGEAEFEIVLGGRFVVEKSHTGEGDSYTENLTVIGFDRRTGKYTLVGMDSRGTGYLTAEGDYDPASRTLTYCGENTDPVTGKLEKYEMHMKLLNEDTLITDIVFPEHMAGKNFKMVETVSKRKKAG